MAQGNAVRNEIAPASPEEKAAASGVEKRADDAGLRNAVPACADFYVAAFWSMFGIFPTERKKK